MHSQKLPNMNVWPPVLACGAWLKNAACLLQRDQVLWSPVHGDLGDPQSCLALEASLERLLTLAEITPHAIAHDLHPDFYSSQLAVSLAERLDVPALAVQHHHAHVAAVMAEHGLDGPVLGL
ncbi:carbamoyltransferase HypF, partial [Pseudomonas sp. AB6]|nr:carbamoyltransferase HypF [Pseudomonas sp. AB6]